MPAIDYEGRRFRSVAATGTGEVDAATRFDYHQEGDIVWASYAGGSIVRGTLIAVQSEDGSLDMRYAHVNTDGVLMTGLCHSTPEVLPDGRLRLHERWRWTSGDQSEGTSIIEEIGNDEA